MREHRPRTGAERRPVLGVRHGPAEPVLRASWQRLAAGFARLCSRADASGPAAR